MWSTLYFLAYYTFVLLVILNLWAALIVEAFENIRNKQKTQKKMNILKEDTTFGLYTRFVA